MSGANVHALLAKIYQQQSLIYRLAEDAGAAAEENARLRAALRLTVSALEMITDPDAIRSSTAANAYAGCLEAASVGRKSLASQGGRT